MSDTEQPPADEIDSVEEAAKHVGWAVPIFGAILIFTLASIAILVA